MNKTEALDNHKVNSEPSDVTLWRYLEWHCDFVSDDAAPTLRLFMGDRLVQSHPIPDPVGIGERSARWFDIVQGVSREPFDPSQFRSRTADPLRDHRRDSRGGRGVEDIP